MRETRRLWSGLEAFNLASRELVLAQVDDDPDRRQRVDALLARTCTVAAGRVEPWRLRVLNLARAGRADEALRVLTEGTLLVADPAPLEWVRIGLLREMGRLDEAEAMARAYLQEHPDDPDMLHDLAVLQGQRGRWRDAAATAERLKTAAPADHRGWLDLGVALARLGRPEAAAATFREGLAHVPEGPARDLLAENLARLDEAGRRP